MSTAKHESLITVRPGATVFDFLIEHGRLPRLDERERPYAYRGWIQPYLQGWEMQLRQEESRYAYFYELWLTGELGDRPIPRLDFQDTQRNGGAALKNIWQCISICDEGGSWSGLTDFIYWLAFGLGVHTEASQLSDKVQAQLYRKFNVKSWLEAPYDYLGDLLCERKKGWNPAGFFPTPHAVVEMMVRMTFGEDEDQRALTVNDPAVGTGRMLLHASNFSLRLSGQDIDPLCVAICKINGALYAPWLAFGLPPSLFSKSTTEMPLIPAPNPIPESLAVPVASELLFGKHGQGLLFEK